MKNWQTGSKITTTLMYFKAKLLSVFPYEIFFWGGEGIVIQKILLQILSVLKAFLTDFLLVIVL